MASTIRLHYTERGRGRPVMLLHGFPFDHTIWAAQVGELSKRFRVITPDLRGHGQTPAPEGVYTMSLMASDVLALMDHLGLDRAAWVGHSMGGYITMAGLRIAPERIAGVGLVATQSHADTPEKRLQRLQSAEVVMAKGTADLALSMMGVLFAPDVDRQSDMAQQIYALMAGAAPAGVAGAQRGMAERPDSADTLRALSAPALVIAGVQDKIVPLDVAQHMAGAIPGAQMVMIEGSGHMPMVEQPAATTAALHNFLESLDFG